MVFSSHGADADGISSAYLYSIVSKDSEINLMSFGEIAEGSDVILDMVPDNPNWEGVVYDHHPHPKKRKYKLFHDFIPTSVIIWKHFHKDIPRKEWWKSCIGAVGDMQAHSIPKEIWDEFPILRSKITQLYGWQHNPFSLKVYQKLSSGINSLCRLGQNFLALEILEECENPIELITDARCVEGLETLKKETNRCLSQIKLVEFDSVVFGLIDSELSVEGRIATQLSNDLKETVLIQNRESGGFSLRGDLTVWIREKIREAIDKVKGITVKTGGHERASGGSISQPEVFILDILMNNHND